MTEITMEPTEDDEDCEVLIMLSSGEAGLISETVMRDNPPNPDSAAMIFADWLNSNMPELTRMAWAAYAAHKKAKPAESALILPPGYAPVMQVEPVAPENPLYAEMRQQVRDGQELLREVAPSMQATECQHAGVFTTHPMKCMACGLVSGDGGKTWLTLESYWAAPAKLAPGG